MDEFIELRRNFYSVPKDVTNLADYEEMPRSAFSSAIHWDDLESEYRTIILAEAGSGKTLEIQQATKRIRAAGKQAFFIRLEYLLDGIEDAFDDQLTGSFHEFDRWLRSDDEGWLFLDSVDEARLSDPRDFEKAIRKLARKLGSACQRSHVFITSRISEWRPKTDLDLLVAQLPYQAEAEATRPNADMAGPERVDEVLFPDIEDDGQTSKPKEMRGTFRVVTLGHLDADQVKQLARALNVTNEQEFFDQIERRDVRDYLSRPKILLNWSAFGRPTGALAREQSWWKQILN